MNPFLEYQEFIMGKKFSTKKKRLRSRAERRRFLLKVNPQPKGVKKSIEQQNLSIIEKLEVQVKAVSGTN